MSLLMDALKKAEQAKQDADKPSRQNTNPQQTSAGTGVPKNQTAKTRELGPEPSVTTQVKSYDKKQYNDELTLQETIAENCSELSLESVSRSLESGGGNIKDGITNRVLPEKYATKARKDIDPDEDAPLLDRFDFAEGSVDPDLVQEKQQQHHTDDTKPALDEFNESETSATETVAAAQPQPAAKQAQEAQTTKRPEPPTANPKTAKQLFNAKTFPGRSRRLPRLIFGAALAFITALAGGGYYYYHTMSELLAKKIAIPLPVTAPETPTFSAKTTTKQEMLEKVQAVPLERKPEIIKEQTILKPVSKPDTKSTVAKIQPPRSAPKKISTVNRPKQAKVKPSPTVAKVPPPIEIKRELEPDRTYQLLQQAYEDFRSGNDIAAQLAYRTVLQQDATNRDALLGLAAINVRHKNFEQATDKYLWLLNRNPKDSVALAALINIQGHIDPVQHESRIKLLLDQEPESPHLFFALGSLYAAQLRWPEAQQAFFKAFHADSNNPDYAYNLAISLDHIGERNTALTYYRTALELVKTQPVSFSVPDVMKRINAINNSEG